MSSQTSRQIALLFVYVWRGFRRWNNYGLCGFPSFRIADTVATLNHIGSAGSAAAALSDGFSCSAPAPADLCRSRLFRDTNRGQESRGTHGSGTMSFAVTVTRSDPACSHYHSFESRMLLADRRRIRPGRISARRSVQQMPSVCRGKYHCPCCSVAPAFRCVNLWQCWQPIDNLPPLESARLQFAEY